MRRRFDGPAVLGLEIPIIDLVRFHWTINMPKPDSRRFQFQKSFDGCPARFRILNLPAPAARHQGNQRILRS
jgi:hypothetical protein